jgi:hypothetical protein
VDELDELDALAAPLVTAVDRAADVGAWHRKSRAACRRSPRPPRAGARDRAELRLFPPST